MDGGEEGEERKEGRKRWIGMTMSMKQASLGLIVVEDVVVQEVAGGDEVEVAEVVVAEDAAGAKADSRCGDI